MRKVYFKVNNLIEFVSKFDYIESNLLRFKLELAEICAKFDRNPEDITIIAVSKTFPSDAVICAFEHGQAEFGENKVQELVDKQKDTVEKKLNWHLIGHLQTNKVKFIVPFIYLIQSLDSLKLALKIQSEAEKTGRIINCLIQVNTSVEEQKSGAEMSETLNLVKEISGLGNMRIKGLMTIAKFIDDYNDESQRNIVKGNFRTLKLLFEEIKGYNIPNVDMKYLSMGMTSDYDMAIEEGSNMLRIGTAIFGQRNYH